MLPVVSRRSRRQSGLVLNSVSGHVTLTIIGDVKVMTHPHITHHFPVVRVVRLVDEREPIRPESLLDANQLSKLRMNTGTWYV